MGEGGRGVETVGEDEAGTGGGGADAALQGGRHREQDVFCWADEALLAVVEQVGPQDWERQMPDDFATLAPGPITLREVLGYHAYDDAWVPDMLAGRSMAEVGEDAYRGELLPRGQEVEAFRGLVERACAAAQALTDPDRVVHCSFGDFRAQEYLWQVNSFRGLRAVDIARVIGADDTLPQPLVEGLWEEISPHAEEWRAIGIFPAAVPVAPDASLQQRLLGLTGRAPVRPDAAALGG